MEFNKFHWNYLKMNIIRYSSIDTLIEQHTHEQEQRWQQQQYLSYSLVIHKLLLVIRLLFVGYSYVIFGHSLVIRWLFVGYSYVIVGHSLVIRWLFVGYSLVIH